MKDKRTRKAYRKADPKRQRVSEKRFVQWP
jgi:hypothetical protein